MYYVSWPRRLTILAILGSITEDGGAIIIDGKTCLAISSTSQISPKPI